MRRLGWMILAVGCGGEAVLPPLAPSPVDVEVNVEETVVASGEPIVVEVTRWTSPEWTLPPIGPGAESLVTTERSVDGPAQVGARTRVIATYELSGEDGAHVIVVPAVEAAGPGDQTRTIEPAPVFVDIGNPPPPLDGLVGLEAVPEEEMSPWWGIAGLVFFGVLIAVALLFRRRSKVPPPLDPADVVARRSWEAARREAVDDHALALALSQIFRRFLQDVTAFPMLARTSREIVGYLEQEALLDDELRRRARQVLDATDRLKFAREGGGTDFFDALEADFLAVVDCMSRPLPEEVEDA